MGANGPGQRRRSAGVTRADSAESEAGPAVVIVPATPDLWADLECVFGSRGDSSRCWCQWFFDGSQVGGKELAASNKEALRAQVESGPPPGLLAYLDGAPAGWCAVAPRPSYGRLRRSTVLPPLSGEAFGDTSIWSITCFVVRVGARRRGVATALLRGAVDLAREHGASSIEGYPVDVARRPSASSSDLYHGTLSTFLRVGFVEVSRPLPARPVVRLGLSGLI